MKGVILAGGNGKRLAPLTVVTNKHLLPVYKKPMIFYPIETLAKAGIKEVLIVTSGEYIGHFYKLIGTGAEWDIKIHYEIQEGSGGTGAALLCAKDFVGNDDFSVILGDNIVYEDISCFVKSFEQEKEEYDAKILIAKVDDPKKYGVVEYEGKKITRLVEKPDTPFSNYVNTGLWIFKSEIFGLCENLKLSVRKEYEITDILGDYAKKGRLTYEMLKSDWTDAGTFEQLYKATSLMHQLEKLREEC
jgi:glucose-1-phosphate thymidylyltransferase